MSGSYCFEIGTAASLLSSSRFSARSDRDAKGALHQAIGQTVNEHCSELIAFVFRWDEAANAPASVPLFTIRYTPHVWCADEMGLYCRRCDCDGGCFDAHGFRRCDRDAHKSCVRRMAS